jgi:Ca2+-binding EF-hand superfamily protein
MSKKHSSKVTPKPSGKKGSSGSLMKHKKGTGGGAANRDKNIDEIADKYAAAKEKRLKKRKVRARDSSKAPSFLDKLVKMIAPPKDVAINAKTRSMLSSLMITEAELDELREIFDSVDVDQASEMDFDEFFELIGEPRNSFTDYIFTLIDNVEKSGVEIIPESERIEEEIENDAPGTAFYARGYLTFDDFVQVVCTFAMYGREDILLYTFNQFDKENTGVIDEREYIAVAMMVNDDKPKFIDNFRLSIASFDKNADGMMDFEQFKQNDARFPLTLFPAYRLQDKIRSTVLGTSTWVDISKRIEEEKEKELYRRKFKSEMPESLVQKFCNLFKRKRQTTRVKKPPSAQETAIRKAAANANSANERKVKGDESSLRREGRGAKAVGGLKTGALEKTKKVGDS